MSLKTLLTHARFWLDQKLLNKYRHNHLCFNDDIQGTGATTLAGLLSALRAKGDDVTALGDQRILIAGAGSAGIGVGQVLKQAMLEQGRSEEEARNCFFVADHKGYVQCACHLPKCV